MSRDALPATPWRRDVGSAYRLRVLVANSPEAYREAISTAIAILRPGVEVSIAAAEDLDRTILQLAPHLVVCSSITRTVENSGAWIELYPRGSPHATVGIDGKQSVLPETNLTDLLAIIDGLESPGEKRTYANRVRQRSGIS